MSLTIIAHGNYVKASIMIPGSDPGFVFRGRKNDYVPARTLKPNSLSAGVQGPPAKLFIPLQFRTPVRTHLHTANQRPRVLAGDSTLGIY